MIGRLVLAACQKPHLWPVGARGDDVATVQRRDVVLVQNDSAADHFLGLDGALRERGLTPDRQIRAVTAATALVVVADLATPVSLRSLRDARELGIPSLLLMDGIVEYRNTFVNPRVGEGFLRPAPAGAVACAGEGDRARLETFGNRAFATGLPRLAPITAMPPPGGASVLVATARTPAFNEEEWGLLVDALEQVRDWLCELGVAARWRLTGGLDGRLGVTNEAGTLRGALAGSSAVITTPSTLLVESMLAGRATALLHPFATPRWQEAAWVLDGGPVEATLRDLVGADSERMARQGELLAALHQGERPAAEALADLCLDLVEREEPLTAPVWPRSIVRLPAPRAARAGRPRVVSMVCCDGSPVGGVTTWSQRLGRAFAECDLGYEVRTLLVARSADQWDPGEHPEWGDETTDACVIDPTAPPHEILDTLGESLKRLEPALVMPNYFDACYAAAAGLRGVRTVAVAHTDAAYYQRLIGQYSGFDAAVGVSDAVMAWLRPIAGARPVHKIVYGVPVAARPREVARGGAIRLAYIGRMVEQQKRIGDLLGVIDGLERRAVAYELHMVGDGLHLGDWVRSLGERTPRSGRVEVHGRRSATWVESFLGTVDCTVLVSDYEGTSISMLEAMGRGVVPVVTAIRSGVDEWVRDGENGVCAPVGEPDAMAERIAALAADRGLIARLSVAAWETARGQSIGAMGERYRGLFDEVFASPARVGPTDAGLRLSELEGRLATPVVRHDEVEAWARARLGSAGYTSISLDRPATGCDAVLVRPGADVSPHEVRTWRRRGLGVVRVPHLTDESMADRMERLVRAAMSRGRRRFAVYGTGKHTRRASGLFGRGLPFVGFIDDAPGVDGRFLGLPVVPLDRLGELKPDAILLSSDLWEERMRERCREAAADGVEVIAVYGEACGAAEAA